jgi:3-oxoacyl-[acyl-carrier protein] reductase
MIELKRRPYMGNRVVIVTGGGSGIGEAIVNRFANNGDIVYALGRDLKKLQNVAKGHQNIHPLSVDITKPAEIEKARNLIVKEHKTIDVLVNNAGGNTKIDPDANLEAANKGWKFIVEVNLTGTFNVTYAFLPHMARPGGRVINITSLAAFAGSSLGGVSGQAYSAAKSGLHGMSRTLSNMVAGEGITVNCVAPGVIPDTKFFGPDGMSKERRAMYLTKIPVGKLGQPEDIAGGVFYLASDEASFITGEILNINGGGQFGR